MHKGRVIFGNLKHRVIELPNISTTRPTSDAVKEAMFNCLIHRFNMDFSQWAVIDAFAGSGALGIEALSLGSPFAVFFEQNHFAYNIVQQNVVNLCLKNKCLILRADVTKYRINKLYSKFDRNVLVILDPPYQKTDVLKNQIIRMTEMFKEKNLIILAETDSNALLNDLKPNYTLSPSGDKKVFFFINN